MNLYNTGMMKISDHADQSRLLAIVESWNLSPFPEFRGFRCAVCQNFTKDGAWHHWLHEDGYRTPVHFCDACEENFKNGIDPSPKERHPVDRSVFMPAFNKGVEQSLDVIDVVSEMYDMSAAPVRKMFTCDACGKDLPNAEGYHVWRNKEGTLIEYHFDRLCGDAILKETKGK
jgi:hypothetical protein